MPSAGWICRRRAEKGGGDEGEKDKDVEENLVEVLRLAGDVMTVEEDERLEQRLPQEHAAIDGLIKGMSEGFDRFLL